MNHLKTLKLFKNEPLWLLSIAAGLEAICITLVWRSQDTGHLGMSLLFLFVTSSLLWDKRDKLHFESDVFSTTVGLLLIGFVLWESATLNVQDTLRLLTFISALGVALLASGFRGLKQYQQELTIMFVLGIPSFIADLLYKHSIFDLSPISAKFAGLILWYSGWEAAVDGVNIYLPTGSIKVVQSCSGFDTINYIFGIAVILLIMFPIARSKRLWVLIFAIILGFVINAIRIAMLAVLEGTNQAAFESWHGGQASYTFGVIGIVIFGLFYTYLSKQEELQDQNKG